jgi:subtilase family serine protease
MIQSRRKRLQAAVEGLDQRCLLSGSGLTPAQIETAYGLGGLTFGGQAANGAGQTIAIVDAFSDPNIQTELAVFDSTNNLPAPPSLRIEGETGTAALPPVDAGWAQEQALDVEWAHALAPGASIVLIEANSGTIPDLMAGVRVAAAIAGVSVVTMSWSGSEALYASPSYDSLFATPGITFVAASGDYGLAGGVQYPASSPNVVSVGGTSLVVDSSGNYLGETHWFGSSGGLSSFEPESPYQSSVQTTGARSTPDVTFDGNPNTGVGVYSIDPTTGQGTWITIAGTSLGAQAWGAVIAIVDQGRTLTNQGTLSSEQALSALYSIPSSDFHSVDGGFNARTGLGTPDGASLINDLVAFTVNTAPPVAPDASLAPAPPPVGPHKKGHHPKVAHHHPRIKVHVHHAKKSAAAYHASQSAG